MVHPACVVGNPEQAQLSSFNGLEDYEVRLDRPLSASVDPAAGIKTPPLGRLFGRRWGFDGVGGWNGWLYRAVDFLSWGRLEAFRVSVTTAGLFEPCAPQDWEAPLGVLYCSCCFVIYCFYASYVGLSFVS